MSTRKIEKLENGNLKITVSLIFRTSANRRKIIIKDDPYGGDETLLQGIARGRRWQTYIDEGRFINATELARSLGRDPGRVASTLRLAMLAPEAIHRFVQGNYPSKITLEFLRGPVPELWDEQMEYLFGKN